MNSLIADELDLVEIIIVHDGGRDNSLAICAEWVRSTPSAACLIDQPNGGLSAARNVGVAHARGLFLGFLDSDDLVDVEVLIRMAKNGRDQGVGCILARSVILDNTNLCLHPFYDHALWQELTGPLRFRCVDLMHEPRLLRLEPNANTRIIRKQFFDENDFHFPVGRLFEDMPVHAETIIKAQHIGLRSETLYFYRVNRFGKLTNERSARRFDAIFTVNAAIEAGLRAGISAHAGAELIRQAVRMLFWCCENVTNQHRLEFAEQALSVLSAVPASWFSAAVRAQGGDPRERLILAAFWHSDPKLITELASRSSPGLRRWAKFLLSSKSATLRKQIFTSAWR